MRGRGDAVPRSSGQEHRARERTRTGKICRVSVTVTALGATCDLVPPERSTAGPGSLRFTVSEFADLSDGRRLVLHDERGWTDSLRTAVTDGEALPADWSPPVDPWAFVTRGDVVRSVLNVVLPDDDDDPDDHPYEWLAGLLIGRGVHTSASELRVLPYEVELSQRLEARLPRT